MGQACRFSGTSSIEALKLLPPGPATDRDVSIVMDKVPGERRKQSNVDRIPKRCSRLQQSAYDYAKAKGKMFGRNGRRGFVGS